MTNTTLDPELSEEREPTGAAPARRALAAPLLIVGRDDDDITGALRVAELPARRDHVNAHVLTVVPPLPFTVPLLMGVDAAPLDEGRRQDQLAEVRQRVHRTV